MPTYLSAELTNKAASPPVMGEFNRIGGRLKVSYATYTMGSDTAEVSADVVQMLEMPKGSILWPHLSYIWWTNCGTTITTDVGDGTNVDKYCSALALGTASTALALLTEAATMDITSLAHEYTAPDTIDLSLTTVDTPNTTGIVYLMVVYSQNG